VPVAKMSGRGLGHTGGTIDKLESIPGYRTALDKDEFFGIVNDIGISLIGQTGNIAPADKKMYALRDVTATVDSMPLIASSIMSKKLASGADSILLDVKTGSGALMKDFDDSLELAEQMVSIGKRNNKKMAALVTDMDVPLGRAIGNSLEVIEAVDTLKGKGPGDLALLCVELSANMLCLAGAGELEECRVKARAAIEDGSAYGKFERMVERQGGDTSVIEDTDKFGKAKITREVRSPQKGYIRRMDAGKLGSVSVELGAGREKKDDAIDHSAGIMLERKTGDHVEAGDILAVLYTGNGCAAESAEEKILGAYEFSSEKPEVGNMVLARIADGETVIY